MQCLGGMGLIKRLGLGLVKCIEADNQTYLGWAWVNLRCRTGWCMNIVQRRVDRDLNIGFIHCIISHVRIIICQTVIE